MINYKQVDYGQLAKLEIAKRGRGNPRTRSKRRYKNAICAFDIETTRVSDNESIMYIWQFQLEDQTIIGRSWKECERFFRKLAACCDFNEYFVIYVHNLSFEFAFLAGLYHFKSSEVFATGSRKVLKCDMYDHLEFRCSYYHSNMSLDEYLSKMGVEHKKTTLDYDKKRYPWTSLTPDELEYCTNDVRGLVEAIKIEMEHDGDNLYTIPLTSTGYVRRDVKKAMREISHGYVKSMLPDFDTYMMLREAFRGGNTHCNRYFAGEILTGVKSVDISSSYPSAECNNKFPVSAFVEFKKPTTRALMDLIGKRGRAVLARIALYNVRLINPFWGCPYLSVDKCRNIVNAYEDNGRILRADYLETTITDIDLKIILSEYAADNIETFKIRHARYGWLPDPLIDVIQDYYKRKTVETGIARVKAKNKLNSVYGMSATNPVKRSLIYDRSTDDSFREDDSVTDEQLLDESNRRAFFPYQWGVFCTCIARYRLEEGLRLAHKYGEFIYCDTDSVKFIGDVDFTEYNAERIADAESSLSFADDRDGVRHYMGVYEPDAVYKRFASRGAKKYAYTIAKPDGSEELHITIAGVNKKAGAAELEAAGGLEHFLDETFTFREKENEAVYVDRVHRRINVDGHRLNIYPCVTIRPSFKTLSDTAEYLELITDAKLFRDFEKKLISNEKVLAIRPDVC